MNIIKDDREWTVKLLLLNMACPFLYYPANYHGCKLLLGLEDDYCKLENCPKIEPEEEK